MSLKPEAMRVARDIGFPRIEMFRISGNIVLRMFSL